MEAVVIDAVRTPMGKRGGALSHWHAADLLGVILIALTERAGIDPEQVDDVICGCVSQVGDQSMNVARTAWLAAGLPESVPATTVDRQCGSSQQALHFAAQGVIAGSYDLVIACGVEHMSSVGMGSNMAGGEPFAPLTKRYGDQIIPQGLSAELVAERWGLSRSDLDNFSARSHLRSKAATETGAFEEEVFPVRAADGSLVERDEGIRVPDLVKMAALPPAFKERGLVTAGNSSMISDGAAAVLIGSMEIATALGLDVRARFVSFAVCGDDPITMLTAPIPATRRALERAGVELEDVDLVEINEAFASVPLAWKKELVIADDWFDNRVNLHGGAIALGHPLGASGARLMTTLVHALHRTGGRYGLQTMCEGGGLANATLVERV